LTSVLKTEQSSSKASHHAFYGKMLRLGRVPVTGPTPPAHPFLASSLVKELKTPRDLLYGASNSFGTPPRFVAGGRFILTPGQGVNFFFIPPQRLLNTAARPGFYPSAGTASRPFVKAG
jgi:hypothetical protein